MLVDEPLNETQKEFAKYIYESAQALVDVVTHILDVSRLSQNQIQLVDEEIRIAEFCEQVIQLSRYQAVKKGLELRYEIASGTPKTMTADPLRLEEVLLCLLSNAIKFTRTGSVLLKVLVSHTSGKPTIRFEVHDTGIGIPNEMKEKIFELFEQADASHTREYGGTGIGLPLCKGILSLMNADLDFQSAVGKGSVFFFEIPQTIVIEEQISERTITPKTSETQAFPVIKKVLIVEDDFVNMKLIHKMMETHFPSFEVFEASSGEEALSQYPSVQPDLILMDIQMPGIDGWETTLRIRNLESEKSKRSIIIAVTAAVDTISHDKCFSVGMDDYLPKPISLDSFVETLRKWTEGKPSTPDA